MSPFACNHYYMAFYCWQLGFSSHYRYFWNSLHQHVTSVPSFPVFRSHPKCTSSCLPSIDFYYCTVPVPRHVSFEPDRSCNFSLLLNYACDLSGWPQSRRKNFLEFPGFSRTINLFFHRLSQQKVNVIMTFIKRHSTSTPAI